MTPIPYDPVEDSDSVDESSYVFLCSACSQELTTAVGELTCPDCGKVVRHGSD